MKKYVLSICIASYNKAEILESLVRSLLTIESDEYNIVVVDNSSTDDSVERIKKINDDRIHVIVNPVNIGGASNTVKASYCGDGMFSLYVNDRDYIIPERIPAFIKFLKENASLAGGTCNRIQSSTEGKYSILDTKTALMYYTFRSSHPTGFFFAKHILDKIPLDTILGLMRNMNFVPLLHEYVFAQCVCLGNVAVYNDVIWRSSGGTTHSSYVSGYVDVNVDMSGKWFHPLNCLNRAKYNIRYIQLLDKHYDLKMSELEYTELLKTILKAEHNLGVWRFRVILRTPSLAYHYAVPIKKESYLKTLINSRIFCEKFISMIKDINITFVPKSVLRRVCVDDNKITCNALLFRDIAKIYKKYFKNVK